MRYSGTETIPASRRRVWQFLTNPDVVAQCVPDVESLDVVDPIHFKATFSETLLVATEPSCSRSSVT